VHTVVFKRLFVECSVWWFWWIW